jgi:hypothetical protein
MSRRQPVVEVIDDQMAEVLRAKTGAEKLAIADRMFRDARRMIDVSVRTLHPHWLEEQVGKEVARRIAGDAV